MGGRYARVHCAAVMHTRHESHTARHGFVLRRFASFLAALTFAVMLVSGVVVFLAPSGRIARTADWTLLGQGRVAWVTMHATFAVLFVVAAAVHLALNWHAFTGYLTDRVHHRMRWTRELAASLALTALLVASAVADWPPAAQIKDANDFFRRTFWADGTDGGRGLGRRDDTTPPLPTSEATPDQGRALFAEHCGRCHTAAALADARTDDDAMRAFLGGHGDSDDAADAAIAAWLSGQAEAP